ncbi:proline-rich receptor-like protein kinase PERK2 [Mauremys reevesii]|uniref:proline-rich receptor-like protein kinase PERK2 n=1 Tax=Mauremys reevesii TaxID=260615 RepID=UPI00193F73AA|nr:proline-rich receptor-like protein kinase PERK2 [Mauremys reevesii]
MHPPGPIPKPTATALLVPDIPAPLPSTSPIYSHKMYPKILQPAYSHSYSQSPCHCTHKSNHCHLNIAPPKPMCPQVSQVPPTKSITTAQMISTPTSNSPKISIYPYPQIPPVIYPHSLQGRKTQNSPQPCVPEKEKPLCWACSWTCYVLAWSSHRPVSHYMSGQMGGDHEIVGDS